MQFYAQIYTFVFSYIGSTGSGVWVCTMACVIIMQVWVTY